MAANQTVDLMDLNEAVKAIKKEEIDAFLSKSILARTKTMFLGSNLHVMMQALKGSDIPCLPQSLSFMNTYTELTTRSK